MKKQFLKAYQAPICDVESLLLNFNLDEESSQVTSTLEVVVKDAFQNKTNTFHLDGENLKLVSIKIDGRPVSEDKTDASFYQLTDAGLDLTTSKASFSLEIQTQIQPQLNTALEGLYKSNGIFCTQCEAQGFRKITYFFDRPDVMTKYTVRIEADQKKYPVLLSNGNRIEAKQLSNGRHFAIWQDPFKKPCYLFALVAGDLGVLKDQFITASKRKVDLEIYAAHGMQDRCKHAMESLKKSMRWDEERFGREYDLDIYMILAVDDFNAGAMENKGLNIFNSRLIFANPQTATDADYFSIESVVAHEYFHNWTGNRVTLRDWFHLSLKEGLTVFRDQEFSMDQTSRGLIRIENVDDLRSSQFAEDAGPNAHPIRPAYCYAVDNFFTPTIYEKGAEVIRMMQTMVGRPGFRKGMDLYFDRHDGQAVIIEDFAKAIADANKLDWEQFKLWYSQAGTPEVTVSEEFDAKNQTYKINLEQNCELTALEKTDAKEDPSYSKKPFHIPLVLGLLDKSGQELKLDSTNISWNSEEQALLHLQQKKQSFIFKNVKEQPVLSINRQFSSPVHIKGSESFEKHLFLMQHDSDSFNRWESAQKIYLAEYSRLIAASLNKQTLRTNPAVANAFTSILQSKLDNDMKALLMALPSFDYLAQIEPVIDGAAYQNAHDEMAKAFAMTSESNLLSIYEQHHGKNQNEISPKEFANRKFKNRSLYYLSSLEKYHSIVIKQFETAKTMTDLQAAFGILIDLDNAYRETAIDKFHSQWKHESLVMNKWFAIQASSNCADTFDRVQKLLSHADFNIKNPNRVYSLLGAFGGNFSQFHRADIDTYAFMAEQILFIDKMNPQVAARLAGSFDIWEKLTDQCKQKAQRALEKMLHQGLSSNTHEIVKNCLTLVN